MAISAGPATYGLGNGASDVTSGAIDTTGMDYIAVYVAYHDAFGEVTVSDSKSNTWTAKTIYTQGTVGVPRLRLFECFSPTSVGSGHTFSTNGSLFAVMAVMAFSGVQTASDPLDAEVGGSAYGTVSKIGSSTLTPSVDGCVVLACAALQEPGGSGTAVGGGFTEAVYQDRNSGGLSHYGIMLSYLIQTTAAAVSSSTTIGSWTSDVYNTYSGAAVKPAGGGGGGSAATPDPVVHSQAVHRASRW